MSAAGEQLCRTSLSRKELILALAAIMLTMLTAVLDQGIATTAMPRAVASLNGFARYSWPSTSFTLSSTIAMLILAKLSDQYGRKRLYLFSLVLFIAATPFSAAAGMLPFPVDGMNQFIIARALLGLGSGGIIVLSYTLVADLFTPAGRAKREGLIASVWTLGIIVGPILGGLISDLSSWRWAFLVSFPLGAIAIFVIRSHLPETRVTHVRHAIDWRGFVALCGWTVPLLIGLTGLEDAESSIRRSLPFLSISVAALMAFLWIERRAREPMVVLRLFRDRRIAVVSANLILTGIAMFAVAVYLPVFLQGVLGWPAAKSALIFTPYLLGIMVGNLVVGQLLSRTGRYHLFALLLSGLVACGLFLFARMDASTTTAQIVAVVILCGFGFGGGVLTYEVLAQNAAPNEHLGVVTGYTQFSLNMGGAIGLAILGVVFVQAYHFRLHPLIPPGIPPALAHALDNPLSFVFENAGSSSAQLAQAGQPADLISGLINSARAGLLFGIHRVYTIGTVLAATAFLCNLFLGRERDH